MSAITHQNKISTRSTNMQRQVSLWPCLLGSSVWAKARTGACAKSSCWDSTQRGVGGWLTVWRHWYEGQIYSQAGRQADIEYWILLLWKRCRQQQDIWDFWNLWITKKKVSPFAIQSATNIDTPIISETPFYCYYFIVKLLVVTVKQSPI